MTSRLRPTVNSEMFVRLSLNSYDIYERKKSYL